MVFNVECQVDTLSKLGRGSQLVFLNCIMEPETATFEGKLSFVGPQVLGSTLIFEQHKAKYVEWCLGKL